CIAQPPVVPISIPKPNVLRTQPKPTIPYPSRLNDQKLREKATNQMEKFFQIFHDLHFDISFANALLLMPKFASTIKSLLTNKNKLFELAKVPLNENCLAMLLKKLPEKLEDPGKFHIPSDFPGIDVCHALADLGARINLMPLLVWKKLLLPELTPTRMTLELSDRSITRPKGVAKDVFVKVGKFHFPTDFVVVDFEADPRVPLILGRSFLRTGRALIDVVDVIDIACEEFVQDVLEFQYNSKSSNPTLVSTLSIFESDFCKKPIVKSSSTTLTPFKESDFFLEEIEDFLNDESIPTGIKNSFYDPEGDILFLEKLLNEDPFQLLPMDLKQAEETKAKSLIEEPPELELKALPSHLEYAFLEDTDKLPVIIAKNLKDVEKEALIKEDYKPAVQSQRRVNPKIHDVIKKEVIKLLDAGMIYPISDSPWVSPIHCVPKKGGMTVVANENNELISTRYFQIPIDPQDQEKTTFTCPYGTFAYRRMTFGLCNAPGMFQRCMIAIFHDMIEKTMEVFMDDFSVFGDSFSSCLTNLGKMLKCCEDTNLMLNWEKCHFMCREEIVLRHKILKFGIEVHRAKVDVIAKLPHPTTVKGVRSFLGNAGFYLRFMQDISKIARPMTHLLEKETPFVFSKECVNSFNTLNKKLTEAPILVVPDWNLPFELMCDANDFAIGAVLGHLPPSDEWSSEGFQSRIKTHFRKDGWGKRASWSDKLDDALWAFRTAFKTPIGCTPYKLVYKKSCHLPIELEHRAYWALKHVNFDLKTAGDHRKLQLNELRYQAYENSLIFKERTKKLHGSKIKNRIFNVGDQVLLFNSRLRIFSGKLKTRWSVPFTITQVFPYGTVELSQPNGPNFKVNGHRVKHYFRGDIPSKVVPDLHTFPMDK
nr:reverse transcriptase domain-containing protein [Tanacetum cinerariifolium]